MAENGSRLSVMVPIGNQAAIASRARRSAPAAIISCRFMD